ncbi:MAG: hypothetical protein JXP73_09230, partial [Deltaproteobacteria bacterium]|nr:hypothetical protein [Deltaproteobacteria bacterium]
ARGGSGGSSGYTTARGGSGGSGGYTTARGGSGGKPDGGSLKGGSAGGNLDGGEGITTARLRRSGCTCELGNAQQAGSPGPILPWLVAAATLLARARRRKR